ncbi:hypothetical protein D3C78_1468570 [compost metagenome]
MQGVFAFLLFTVVAFDLDSDTGQRDVFFLRVHLQSQRFAGAEGRIEIVVRLRCRAFAAGGFRHVGKQFVIINLYGVTKTFSGDGIDGNSHGNLTGSRKSRSIKKDLAVIEHSHRYAFHFPAG